MRLALLPALFLMACRPAVGPSTPVAGDTGPLAQAVVRGPDGPVSTATFLERVSQADMICVGEQHDDAAHHAVQHALFEQLVEGEQRQVALGLEMVQRPWQTALDDYLRGDLDASRLAEVVEWNDRWGFDFTMYEPLFHTAHDHRARLIALNAPQELTRAVARMGLDRLPREVAESLPDLQLDDDAHRRFFWAAMGFGEPGAAHGAPHHGDPHHGDPTMATPTTPTRTIPTATRMTPTARAPPSGSTPPRSSGTRPWPRAPPPGSPPRRARSWSSPATATATTARSRLG